jgi:glycine C-acetyltransferase
MLNKSLRTTNLFMASRGFASHAGLTAVCKQTVADIKEAGTYKTERVISTAQDMMITANGKEVLNFCANNYLGLANHPRIVQAAKDTLDTHGFGMASVRFICGT